MKKYLSLMLAFLLSIFSIGSVNAKMTGPFTLTVDNAKSGHVYEAYQIFAGDVSIDGNTADNTKIISNIVWGDGVDSSFTTKTAKEYAEILSGYTSNSDEIIAATKELANHLISNKAHTGAFDDTTNTYTISNLESGYYLVRDKKATLDGTTDDMGTGYIVKLVDNIEVTPKTSIPTPTKVIDEGNGVKATANYAFGEKVPFKLTGTLPTNYDFFESYQYIFHDTLDDGLTFNANSVKVYVGNTEIVSGFELDTTATADHTFAVKFANTKANTIKDANGNVVKITKDSVITVKYNATVNTAAVSGLPGNENKMVIEYSNNPGTNETGKTTEVTAKVYVFDLKFNKIRSDGNTALPGAQFKIERKNGNNWETVSGITYTVTENGTVFTFRGLSNGTYKVTETTTPDGYNTIKPFEFTIDANYDEDDATELESLDITSTETNEVARLSVEDTTTNSTVITTVTNIKGITLPLTGGIGTTIFTILGLVIMAVAALTLFKSKKENN